VIASRCRKKFNQKKTAHCQSRKDGTSQEALLTKEQRLAKNKSKTSWIITKHTSRRISLRGISWRRKGNWQLGK